MRFLAFLLLLPSLAFAAANDVHLTQVNSSNTGTITRVLNSPSTVGILYYDKPSNVPRWATFAPEVSITGGVLSVSGVEGPAGPQGIQGIQGEQGVAGPAGAGLSSITSPSRSLNTNFTVSTDRPAFVAYNVKLEVTNPLLAGSASATATLQYSTNGGTSWTTVNAASAVATVGLTVSVAILNAHEHVVTGFVPAGALVRITSSTAGVGTVTLLRGQEVLF